MQCATHSTAAATAICTRCDKLLCAACARDYHGKTFCAGCAEFLGQRDQQRQAPVPASPALAAGPAEVYGGPAPADVVPGPAPGQSPAPSGVYQGPAPAGAPQRPAVAANPYQSTAPGVAPGPPVAANPYQSPPPAAAPKPLPANPYQSAAPGAAPGPPAAGNPYQSPPPVAAPKPPPANPYQSAAPGVAPGPSPAANPYQSPAPAAMTPPASSLGLDATLSPPAGDVYQGSPPAGDVYQGSPPAGDVYQGPPPGDVYQGPPADDGLYQGPPADGTYQGPPAAGVPASVMLENADNEGSMGRAAMMSAIAGLVGVLISWGISAATGKILKLSSVWLFLGPMIGRAAVQGAGRGGGDVALLAGGVTVVALFLAEIIVGYQRGYIQVGILDWIFWGIGGYWAYRIPAERA